ncbi:MAG: hypothetical protein ACW99F_09320 [Candidatus Hodarchaeales archaeon]|jgi:hypothetical protein
MVQERSDIPKIELAKSGRSTCRTCQKKIQKDTPRIGIPFPFTAPTGEVVASYRFYHVECTPRYNVTDVLSFLKKESFEKNDLYISVLTELETINKKEGSETEELTRNSKKPYLQPSKSSRGKCRSCSEKIEKGVIRVAVPSLVELDDGRKFSSNKYYHIKCYINQIENVDFNLMNLVDQALQANHITKEEASEIKSEFSSYLDSDTLISEVLNRITSTPIKIKDLRKISREKQIDFKLVEAAIERGLMKGEYFNPTPVTIQKMT